MQFHLNGFRPGDPNISEADARHQADAGTNGLPSQIDVLIVGCGPTGLTLAAQLAAFPDITTRIIEQKSGRLLIGQADGIACRTMEMFEAFGFADRVMNRHSPDCGCLATRIMPLIALSNGNLRWPRAKRARSCRSRAPKCCIAVIWAHRHKPLL